MIDFYNNNNKTLTLSGILKEIHLLELDLDHASVRKVASVHRVHDLVYRMDSTELLHKGQGHLDHAKIACERSIDDKYSPPCRLTMPSADVTFLPSTLVK